MLVYKKINVQKQNSGLNLKCQPPKNARIPPTLLAGLGALLGTAYKGHGRIALPVSVFSFF